MDRRGIAATLFSTVLAGGIGAMIGVAALPEASPYFTVLLYGGVAAIAIGLLGLIALFIWPWKPNRRTDVTDEVGDENTLVGGPFPEKVGSRNTIVNVTDANGNTIFNQPTSIGYRAGYAPDSTIIGAYAAHNLGGSVQPPKKASDDEVPHRDNDQEE